LALGVDPEWSLASLSEGGTFRGANGCRVSLHREPARAALRLVHADDASTAIEWHSLAHLEQRDGRTLLEHGAGRLVPRGTRLDPVAAAPAVLSSLLERAEIEL